MSISTTPVLVCVKLPDTTRVPGTAAPGATAPALVTAPVIVPAPSSRPPWMLTPEEELSDPPDKRVMPLVWRYWKLLKFSAPAPTSTRPSAFVVLTLMK